MNAQELRIASMPVVMPALAAAVAAVRVSFGPGLSAPLILGVALAPVWWPVLRRYHFARLAVWLGLAAAAWGIGTTLLDIRRPTSVSLMLIETFTQLAMVGGIGLLLWARTCIGSAWTVVAFGVGGLVNVFLTGGNEANLWKYSLSIPVAMILLGLASARGSRGLELTTLILLSSVSAVSDSRSFTSFLLLAVALVLWQMAVRKTSGRARPWRTILGLAVVGLAAFSLFQSLILDGVLGDAAQQRTEAQLDASGSLIAGGRPELGAAIALLSQQPWGYGSGTLPTSADVWLAKTGMSDLNYDPNNGYVEVFMFGGHFEVHSVIGDLWIRFGPPGAALAMLIIAVGMYAVARRLSVRAASGALILLALLGAWDTFFSPFLSSYRTLALLFALAAIPAIRTADVDLTDATAISTESPRH